MSGPPKNLTELLAESPTNLAFSASDFLDSHPEFRNSSVSITEVILEEFFRRVESGEEQRTVVNDLQLSFPSEMERVTATIRVCEDLALQGRFDNLDESVWPLVGEELEGLVFEELIGSGHCSRVYRCSEPEIGNRKVVVKATSTSRNEVQYLGKLRHENIVEILTAFQIRDRNLNLIVMPFEGTQTLADVCGNPTRQQNIDEVTQLLGVEPGHQRVGRQFAKPKGLIGVLGRRRAEQEVCRIGIEMASALAFAHSKNVIHCDIKPSNVLLLESGKTKLMDFSLSTRTDWDESDLLLSGGTPPYMAPEHPNAIVGDRSFDHRADIYSLGVMLQEILTGACLDSPEGDSVNWANGYRKTELLSILRTCTRENPDERFQSAEELKTAFENVDKARARRRAARRLLLQACAFGLIGGVFWSILAAPSQPTYEKALELAERSEFKDSLEMCNRCLGIDPEKDHLKLLALRAHCNLKLKNYNIALQDLVEISRERPTGIVNAEIGYAAALGRINVNFIIGYFERAIEFGKPKAEVYNNIANAYRLDGQMAESESSLKKAISALPQSTLVWLNKAKFDFKTALRANGRLSLEPIETAIELAGEGKQNPLLFINAALMYAYAFEYEPSESKRVRFIELAELAVKNGATVNYIDNLKTQSEALTSTPEFMEIQSRAPKKSVRLELPLYIDPLEDSSTVGEWIQSLLAIPSSDAVP